MHGILIGEHWIYWTPQKEMPNDMDFLETTNRISEVIRILFRKINRKKLLEKNFESSDKWTTITSNVAIAISIATIFLNIIAYLDEIVSFLHYVLSYQH